MVVRAVLRLPAASPAVVVAVAGLLLAGCANVDTPSSSGGAAVGAASPAACRPPLDQLPFAVIATLRAPAKSLRRPFSMTKDGKVLLGADVIDAAGAVVQPGAVWVADDMTGKGLASVNAAAKASSSLPAASGPGEDDPVVQAVAQCPKTG